MVREWTAVSLRSLRTISFGIACTFLMAASAPPPARLASGQAPIVFQIVDKFLSSPPVDHDTVERVGGIPLARLPSDFANNYAAKSIALGDSTSIESVDYRESLVGMAAKNGPMLAFKLSGTCISQDQVLEHYQGLETSSYPEGHSKKEQTYISRNEPWGSLSFGFSQEAPDCLRTVVLSMRLAGQPPSFGR